MSLDSVTSFCSVRNAPNVVRLRTFLPESLAVLVGATRQWGRVLQDVFPKWKYHEHCTLWGVSYFWDGNVISLHPRGEESFVPELLRLMEKNEGVQEPAYQVSRRRDPVMYQIMNCLANRDGIEHAVEELLHEEYVAVEPFLSDKRLLTEAVERYVAGRKSDELDEKIDLIHFLLYYHVPERKLSLHQYGSFEPLAKRLTLRYSEEHAEERIFTLVPEDLAREARTLHEYALYGRILAVAPELESAHQRMVGSHIAKPVIAPPKVTSVSLPGRKRVKHRNHALDVDWEDLLKGRQQRVTVTKAFNREELLKQEMREKLIREYFPVMEREPQRALRELEVRYRAASAAERSVFEEVLEIFQGMQVLEQSDSIAHQMHVPVRRK